MTTPTYDDPRWRVAEEHEDTDGTWTQRWELVDDDGSRHVREAAGINRRARTPHPPADLA